MSRLPAWIAAALDSRLEHVSRAELRERARLASETYRAGGTSDLIRTEADALAYAVARMPATYAAVRASLAETARVLRDFTPVSLLDIGAGPGTASWAAAETWPSLRRLHWIERNPALLALGQTLRAAPGAPPLNVAVSAADLAVALDRAEPADVVIASYTLTELAPASLASVLARLWALAERLMVLVEPGTTAGFRRVLDARTRLLADGATIAAPCSHDEACPLADDPRWCHFAVRLPRSRDHLLIKDASVPYEDEKFIYLAAAKDAGTLERGRRVLATPKVSKASVTLDLCAPETVEHRIVARRDKDAYRAAKRCDWGDAVPT